MRPQSKRPPSEFLAALRSLVAGMFGLTAAEQRAILTVLALLLLGCLVRYGGFLGVSPQ